MLIDPDFWSTPYYLFQTLYFQKLLQITQHFAENDMFFSWDKLKRVGGFIQFY